MTTTNSNPFAIGFTMVGVLLLLIAALVHLITENVTGLYYFSLSMFVISFFISISESE